MNYKVKPGWGRFGLEVIRVAAFIILLLGISDLRKGLDNEDLFKLLIGAGFVGATTKTLQARVEPSNKRQPPHY